MSTSQVTGEQVALGKRVFLAGEERQQELSCADQVIKTKQQQQPLKSADNNQDNDNKQREGERRQRYLPLSKKTRIELVVAATTNDHNYTSVEPAQEAAAVAAAKGAAGMDDDRLAAMVLVSFGQQPAPASGETSAQHKGKHRFLHLLLLLPLLTAEGSSAVIHE